MPSGLSLQKPRPGIGMVVLVDGALVVPLGLGVVLVAGAVVVTAGFLVVLVGDAVVVKAGFLVVVDGRGGISVRKSKTKLYKKVHFVKIWLV